MHMPTSSRPTGQRRKSRAPRRRHAAFALAAALLASTGTLVVAPAVSAQAADGCWVYSVENPHLSTSNPGKVDAKSWAKRSKGVSSMTIYTQLYVNGSKYGAVRTSRYGPVDGNRGYRGWSQLLSCRTGSWKAEVWLDGVQYGGRPFRSIGKAYSNTVTVKCSPRGGGGGGGGR